MYYHVNLYVRILVIPKLVNFTPKLKGWVSRFFIMSKMKIQCTVLITVLHLIYSGQQPSVITAYTMFTWIGMEWGGDVENYTDHCCLLYHTLVEVWPTGPAFCVWCFYISMFRELSTKDKKSSPVKRYVSTRWCVCMPEFVCVFSYLDALRNLLLTYLSVISWCFLCNFRFSLHGVLKYNCMGTSCTWNLTCKCISVTYSSMVNYISWRVSEHIFEAYEVE